MVEPAFNSRGAPRRAGWAGLRPGRDGAHLNMMAEWPHADAAARRYLFSEVFDLKPTSELVLESEPIGRSRGTPKAEHRIGKKIALDSLIQYSMLGVLLLVSLAAA